MADVGVKDSLRALIAEVSATADSKWKLQLRGVAMYDSQKDAKLTPLPTFGPATEAIISIPNFIGRYGAESARRIVLQFIYQYFARVDVPVYDQTNFDALWADFDAEMQEAYWVARGVVNIRNFHSESVFLNLGDGVTIRGRDDEDLASLGFGPGILERIAEDWRENPGTSSFVLVAEHSFAKEPNNLALTDGYSVSVKAMRTLWSLRLASAGSISFSRMWLSRSARFNVGIGGISSTGFSVPAWFGEQYKWTESTSTKFKEIYNNLTLVQINNWYNRAPGNLEIALRTFMRSYDLPGQMDSQLVDIVTSLEAILGLETEIAFRLAFRVAGLLAPSDHDRGIMLNVVKGFYDTRSRVIHGSELKEKHRNQLLRTEELRSIARRLLRSFVGFAAAPVAGYGKTFFQDKLDAALVNSIEREKLQKAFGLNAD